MTGQLSVRGGQEGAGAAEALAEQLQERRSHLLALLSAYGVLQADAQATPPSELRIGVLPCRLCGAGQGRTLSCPAS